MSRFFAVIRDGLVVGAGTCSTIEVDAQEAMPGFVIAWLADEAAYAAVAAAPGDYRIEAGEVVVRDVMPPIATSAASIAADGVEAAVLTGLPNPCRVTITGAVQWGPGDVADGTLALTSTVPGRIAVRIACDPLYRPWSGSIDAS